MLNLELLAQCAQVDVSTWSDALDQLNIQGVLQGITQRSGQGRMVGFAITARQTSSVLGDFDKGDFAVGRLVQSTGPGLVLVVDVGGQPISTLGGLAALACSQRNAGGVVIDGACRDLREIQATGLWLASRWVAPTTGKGRLRLEPLGLPVTVGGVLVHEGDLVVGDDTGLVVVPRQHLTDVLARAQAILRVDTALEQRLRRGEDFVSASNATGYMPTLVTAL
jgi:regulator of RNase E activity RraA